MVNPNMLQCIDNEGHQFEKRHEKENFAKNWQSSLGLFIK